MEEPKLDYTTGQEAEMSGEGLSGTIFTELEEEKERGESSLQGTEWMERDAELRTLVQNYKSNPSHYEERIYNQFKNFIPFIIRKGFPFLEESELEDASQCAWYGVLAGIKKYNWDNQTYAVSTILYKYGWAEVLNGFAARDGIPKNVLNSLIRWRRTQGKIIRKGGNIHSDWEEENLDKVDYRKGNLAERFVNAGSIHDPYFAAKFRKNSDNDENSLDDTEYGELEIPDHKTEEEIFHVTKEISFDQALEKNLDLTPQEREVFELRYYLGLSGVRIAEIQNVSDSRIDQVLKSIVTKYKRYLLRSGHIDAAGGYQESPRLSR